MKKTHFLTYCLITLFLLSSCGCGGERIYTYTIRNESSVPIKLKGYEMRTSELKKTLVLGHEEEHTKKHIEYLPPSGGYDFYIYFNHSDSLEVIYNNKKKDVFILDEVRPADSLGVNLEDTLGVFLNDRNPLNTLVYRDFKETFIITEEDYESAEYCEGDCE